MGLLKRGLSVADTHAAVVISHKGHQRQMPRSLDGYPQDPLVPGADSGPAARLDFGPVGDVPAQLLHVLIIDVLDVVHAKGAYPPAWGVTASGAPSRPPASRTSLGPSSSSPHRGSGSRALFLQCSLPFEYWNVANTRLWRLPDSGPRLGRRSGTAKTGGRLCRRVARTSWPCPARCRRPVPGLPCRPFCPETARR